MVTEASMPSHFIGKTGSAYDKAIKEHRATTGNKGKRTTKGKKKTKRKSSY